MSDLPAGARSPARVEPANWPEYCCAILRDGAGRYLLERRPQEAKYAPGVLACFGGKREPGEHPDRCLRRELREELGWNVGPLHLRVAVRLLGEDGRVIAWFYRGRPPRDGLRLRTLSGSKAEWLAPDALTTADLSAWHRAALEAELRGERAARVRG